MIRYVLAQLAGTLLILGLAGWFVFHAVPAQAAGCDMVRASWYGAESGNRTASGMAFNGRQWLVAHKSLPFGTKLRLTYRGRSVVVPVEDRGPYVAGRTLDLSAAVAERLGTKARGVVTLCMERL